MERLNQISSVFDRALPIGLERRVCEMASQQGVSPEKLIRSVVETALSSYSQGVNKELLTAFPAWNLLAPDELVSPDIVSRRTHLSQSKLAKMRCRGDGPKYVKLGARTVCYRVRDVDEFLNGLLKQSTSEPA